jgi:methylated-DNA-[protein]-cysteine S-methyltransferase
LQTYRACHHSQIGPLEVVGNQKGILTIIFGADEFETDRNMPAPMAECLRQLTEYFKGRRQKFSYGDVARAVGSPRAFRAVGNANNKNPIPLIIPCHRVIGSDGKLVGFGGGIWRKHWLLEHEKNQC